MSSNVRWDALGSAELLANATKTVASNGTSAFDFGTPNDINLATAYNHGDTLLVVLSATRAAGTTDTLTFTIQDADDSAGSIGTPAAAVTSGTIPSFAADSGAINKAGVVAVKLQSGRPWLRVNTVHAGGGTDSFVCHCSVYSVKNN